MNTSRTLRAIFISASILAATATGQAQTVSPVPAPTIITTAPYKITKPGFYQLGANLTYFGNGSTNDAIITIAASNVTLDFGGHYISGPSNTPATKLYGVYAYEEGNLTIQNGTVTFCFVGIGLIGNAQSGSLNINQRVQNLLVSYCYYSGSLLFGATNSQVGGNRVSFIGGTTVPSVTYPAGSGSYVEFFCAGYANGLNFAEGSGNTALNNSVTNLTATNNYGIADSFGNEVVATGNTISQLSGTGYAVYGCSLAVNNILSNCTNGLSEVSKYANNLTSGCTTAFTGGTGVGYNN